MKVLLSSQESVKQESPSISPSDWVDERQLNRLATIQP